MLSFGCGCELPIFLIAESASLGCNSTQFDCFGDGTMCLDPDKVCMVAR